MSPPSIDVTTWQRVVRHAHDLLHKIGPITPTTPKVIARPSYSLPTPQSIAPHLQTAGLPSKFAEQLSNAYLQMAMKLKADYERKLEEGARVWIKTASERDVLDDFSSVGAMYTRQYQEILRSWVQLSFHMAARRISELRAAGHSQASKGTCTITETRSSFKQVRIPRVLILMAQTQFKLYRKPYLSSKQPSRNAPILTALRGNSLPNRQAWIVNKLLFG